MDPTMASNPAATSHAAVTEARPEWSRVQRRAAEILGNAAQRAEDDIFRLIKSERSADQRAQYLARLDCLDTVITSLRVEIERAGKTDGN